nr:16S rRNA (adenine(1518)-N(6)/adenine(1519)-N(6))-dimethyltransferase RsmA [Ardenticatena sp.]
MKRQDVRRLLAAHGLRPRKGLGQNFLVDETALQRIAETADLTPSETVVEIGPGLGALTEYLLARAGHLIAIELDPNMVAILQERFGDQPHFHLVEGDVLKQDIPALVRRFTGEPRYKVTANLPYYITSAAIRHLLESRPAPDLIVLLVQREVAERIVATPGNMSVLAVSVQVYGTPTLVARVPAGAFYPPPKVESALLKIEPHATPHVQPHEAEAFFRLVRAGFHQKRKQLRNTLAAGLGLPKHEIDRLLQAAGIQPSQRAESLSIDDWRRLFDVWRTNQGDSASSR